ncbi:MAG: potassium channel family protein [Gemmatimonadota bacterium]
MREFLRRFAGVLALVVILVVVGTAGFQRFPGWSLSDALYMTLITLTAVGYQEVHPLTDGGRMLAGFLVAGGITAIGLWFALLTSALVEMDLAHVFRTRRTMKEIGKLRNHILVCGAGRTGRQVIREFEEAEVEYVVIENRPERAAQLRETCPRAHVLEADATRDEALVDAGIRAARGLVACLSGDTDNLFVCLSARDLQPDLTIVARAYDEETLKKLYKAGADHVVSPNLTGGSRMASMLLRPEVISFLDVVTRGDGLTLRLEQVPIADPSELSGRTLAEARIPQRTGLIVIAVRRAAARDGFEYNPGPDEVLRSGDVLVVLGTPEQVGRLRDVAAG